MSGGRLPCTFPVPSLYLPCQVDAFEQQWISQGKWQPQLGKEAGGVEAAGSGAATVAPLLNGTVEAIDGTLQAISVLTQGEIDERIDEIRASVLTASTRTRTRSSRRRAPRDGGHFSTILDL